MKVYLVRQHSVSNLRVLYCPCVLRESTAHVGTKVLNMRHQSHKGFRGIFVVIPQHQKVYLVYVPTSRKIISSYDVVFGEGFSNALAYTSQHYSYAMSILLAVSYTPYDTSSRKKTGDIITFTQFEEGNLLSETCDNTGSGNKYHDDSTLPPFNLI